jgi:hypothetical protein
METRSFPHRLYLKTTCPSLDKLEEISAQVWTRFVFAAARFSGETAEKLAAQARKSGAKDSKFKAIPFTLGLLSEDCDK